MCLTMRFKPEVEKKMIAKLPDGLITVYRVIHKYRSVYKSLFWNTAFRIGVNHANTTTTIFTRGAKSSYKSGYHSFVTLQGVHGWWHLDSAGTTRKCVKFQIRKEWITAIGRQNGCIVYATDRIISPSLRDKSAVLEQP